MTAKSLEDIPIEDLTPEQLRARFEMVVARLTPEQIDAVIAKGEEMIAKRQGRAA